MRLSRWVQSIPNSVRIGAVILLLAVVMGEYISNSRLQAEVARSQVSVSALLRERAVLLDDVQAWKTEAVEWREKNGYVEPPSTPPSPDDENREPISAPSP